MSKNSEETLYETIDLDDIEEFSYSSGDYSITEREIADENSMEIIAIHKEKPEVQHVVAKIDRNNKSIVLYPNLINRRNYLNKVIFEGFESIDETELFSKSFSMKQGLGYFIDKYFIQAYNLDNIVVSKDKKSELGIDTVVFNYCDLLNLYRQLSKNNTINKAERRYITLGGFSQIFNQTIGTEVTEEKIKVKKIISLLDKTIIEHIDKENLSELMEFYGELLKSKYSNNIKKRATLIKETKLKIDEITLNDVITKFEVMLGSENDEAQWGEFLRDNLYLVDTRYYDVIPQLNLILGGTRYVDFGLIDIDDYLDLVEIKKPDTPLLTKKTNRGNYFWTAEAASAIVQLEKYFFNAERKASNLQEDIKREFKKSINIKKPRAILIIGTSSQLDNDNKKDDFRVLRQSLKNIEIVLYDELLNKIKNFKKRFK